MRAIVFAVLAVVFMAGVAFAEVAEKNIVVTDTKVKDYVCKICYEPVPTDRVACETLVAPTLEGVQQMIMAAAEAQQGVDKVTVECSFPTRTEKGCFGYIAEIRLKK
ncbi:hypothetical protein [Thermodesulfovibrio yellowstonii]|uniref:Uncharacterized protein n=1 Tax=Thermodesulfovibrio yellowstonii TaxID=28262 RepID=A0A9W6GHH2_9BACT|nr:hypothetical protein [Thermodesulfovibrio islandicus]GLI53966.1 hypothetical protein TISLANDTSLP1_16590 [Thermodesulfovibrio islandicus]